MIGAPDETGGEVIKGFVASKDGRKLEKGELAKLCREHLAPYKMPGEIILASFLPKNSIGKILKRELKEDVGTVVS